MKSETVTLQDKRTKFRMVEVKSDKIQLDGSEKTLGLFEDNSYRDEEMGVTGGMNSVSSSKSTLTTTNFAIFPLILTLLLNFCQFSET